VKQKRAFLSHGVDNCRQ